MADALTGVQTGGDDVATTLDYLGKKQQLSFSGQPALPQVGAPASLSATPSPSIAGSGVLAPPTSFGDVAQSVKAGGDSNEAIAKIRQGLGLAGAAAGGLEVPVAGERGDTGGVSLSDQLRSADPGVNMDLFGGFNETPVTPGSDVPGFQGSDGAGGSVGLGGIVGGAGSLLGLGQGISQGDPVAAARGGTGLLSALQSIFFPETTASAIIGNALGTAGIGSGAAAAAGAGAGEAAAASSLGALAPYIAPIIQSIGTGLNIAERSDKGIPAGDQAGMAAIDLLTQGIPIAGGALAGALDNLFYAHYPSHEQRDTLDEANAQRILRNEASRIQGAGTYEDLAGSLNELFSNQYKELPYPTIGGVGAREYDMGPEGMRSMPDRDALAKLFAGDPGAISFDWQQGTRPEFNTMMSGRLNEVVRGQAALIQAAQAGDPQAKQLLQQLVQHYAQGQEAEQEKSRQMYYNYAHPWETDPGYFQAGGGGDSGGGASAP